MGINYSADLLGFGGVSHLSGIMNKKIEQRITKKVRKGKLTLKFPTAIIFVRGDRGGDAQELAKSIMHNFNYWDFDSGDHIDIIFPGWTSNSDFSTEAFVDFKTEIEESSKWQYSGETDILLLNYAYYPKKQNGELSFEETITLPVEEMLSKEVVRSVEALLQELINAAKKEVDCTVWEISDRVAVQRGRKMIWEFLKRKFMGSIGKELDSLEPFAVCNLRSK
jgi:hypothetical protein